MPNLPQQRDRLQPSEALFDTLPLPLTAMQKIGHRRKVGLIVPHLVTVPFLTADSEMLGIVPLRLARALSPSLGLRILELPLEVPPLTMSLVWHERHQQDAPHRWFREFVAPNAVRP